ncbi:MAG: exodeoxyribonuclease VII small subunit [Treponema sp.]|nr:exodeoxyribonuclease VII small subunit [Treponema sp.]
MNNFEENLAKLEALSAAIRQPDISVEDALRQFEEGITLARRMEKELDAIESKIQILMQEPPETTETNGTQPEPPASEEKKAHRPHQKKSDGPVLELFSGSTEINGTRNS